MSIGRFIHASMVQIYTWVSWLHMTLLMDHVFFSFYLRASSGVGSFWKLREFGLQHLYHVGPTSETNSLILFAIPCIPLFKSITLFCETYNILWNILHIQTKCGNIWKYFVKYCWSHKPLLQIWIMLCVKKLGHCRFTALQLLSLIKWSYNHI